MKASLPWEQSVLGSTGSCPPYRSELWRTQHSIPHWPRSHWGGHSFPARPHRPCLVQRAWGGAVQPTQAQVFWGGAETAANDQEGQEGLCSRRPEGSPLILHQYQRYANREWFLLFYLLTLLFICFLPGWQILVQEKEEQRGSETFSRRTKAEGEPDHGARLLPGKGKRCAAAASGRTAEGLRPLQEYFGSVWGKIRPAVRKAKRKEITTTYPWDIRAELPSPQN